MKMRAFDSGVITVSSTSLLHVFIISSSLQCILYLSRARMIYSAHRHLYSVAAKQKICLNTIWFFISSSYIANTSVNDPLFKYVYTL